MIIYKIKNTINNKIYIGQTVRTLEKRINQHKRRKNCVMYSAFKKYGFDNFEIEKIDEASTIEELNQKEQYWINKLNSIFPNGYNLDSGGKNRFFSEVSKKRMSESFYKAREKYPFPRTGMCGKLSNKSKPILCLNNNVVYESGRQAAIALNLHRSHVNSVARGNRKSTNGYRFIYIKP